jgi:hypothetical protein
MEYYQHSTFKYSAGCVSVTPVTWEAKAGGLWVEVQPGLQSKITSQKKKVIK